MRRAEIHVATTLVAIIEKHLPPDTIVLSREMLDVGDDLMILTIEGPGIPESPDAFDQPVLKMKLTQSIGNGTITVICSWAGYPGTWEFTRPAP